LWGREKKRKNRSQRGEGGGVRLSLGKKKEKGLRLSQEKKKKKKTNGARLRKNGSGVGNKKGEKKGVPILMEGKRKGGRDYQGNQKNNAEVLYSIQRGGGTPEICEKKGEIFLLGRKGKREKGGEGEEANKGRNEPSEWGGGNERMRLSPARRGEGRGAFFSLRKRGKRAKPPSDEKKTEKKGGKGGPEKI